MIIPLTEHYQLAITRSLHWGLICVALIGLVITCALIYRRFKEKHKNAEQQVVTWKPIEKSHFIVLILGNIVAFISVLLLILPLQARVDSTSFDVLLTSGFNKSASAVEFNLVDLNSKQVQQKLKSAKYIWLLDENNDPYTLSKNAKLLQQSLLSQYQDKVIVVNSVADLTTFWQTGPKTDKSNNHTSVDSLPYSVPSSLAILGDGLTDEQWQHLLAFKQRIQGQQANSALQTDLQSHLSDNAKQSVNNHATGNNIKFTFFASTAQFGLVDLQWQRELMLGQALIVTGRLQQPMEDNREFTLSLISNNHVMDQVNIKANQPFSLSTTSKITGLFTYQLLLEPLEEKPASQVLNHQSQNVSDESVRIDETVSETIAVSVISGNVPRILIKQSAPSFETRRLKQWLKQSGSQVHIISQISQSKWAQQKINYAPESLEQQRAQVTAKSNAEQYLLTKSLLAENDLLLIDSRMLLALESAEVEALYQAIKNGLGLFIYADATLVTSDKPRADKVKRLLNLFRITSSDEERDQVTVNWPEKPHLAPSQSITSPSPSIIISPKEGQSIVQSLTGRALVAQQSLGLGTVAISVLDQTYQWPLQATPALYSYYWQYLFSTIARSESKTRWLTPTPSAFVRVNYQQNVCLLSPVPEVYSPSMNLTLEPLSQIKKCAGFSARNQGWYEFQAFNAKQVLLATQSHYFYGETNFLAWQQEIKHKISKKYAPIIARTESTVTPVIGYQAADKRNVWLLMLITLSLLWIERKWQTS